MKIFKKIAALCMAISLCVGVGALATSCGGGDNDASSSQQQNETTGYLFKVVNADGSAASDVYVQLCDGVSGICYGNVAVDETGSVLYNSTTAKDFPGAGVYDIHVLGGEFMDDFPFDGPTATPEAYSTETIVLTLK